jgi:LuxR family maltose regulon positive regulatory protein
MTPRQLPVLVSKLGPPPVPSFAVTRARLVAPLLERDWRVAVITGGAGTGKSVVAAQCCAALTDASAAWVTLDASDDRPERFWLYLVAALELAVPGAFTETAARVPNARNESDDLLTQLLVEAATLTRPLVVVLDDLHTIRDPQILGGIRFLVEHAPAQLRLMVTSRSEPSLPIAHWTARTWTVEIRQDDLACSSAETIALLAALGEHRLAHDDIDHLRLHTEGWMAALHLAALAMHGKDDAASVARNFTGRHRMIADLLMSEVLEAQTSEVQEFLLRTSIVEHFDGVMADALTGRTDGAAALDSLAARIAFLVPLDDQRTTYRYHPLLRDLLQLELDRRHPNERVHLRRTAAATLEARGEITAAVNAHLGIGDVDRAFALAFSTAYQQHDRGDLAAMASWVDLFPQDFVAESIERMLVYSFSIGACGRIDEAMAWIDRVKHRMSTEADVAERDLRYADALQLMLFTIGGLAQDGIECGQRVVAAVDQGLDIGTLGARARPNLARAHLLNDEPRRAEEVLDGGPLHDEFAATLLAPAIRSRVALRDGHLHRAMEQAARALAAAATLDAPTHLGTLDALLAQAGVLVERNQMVDAVAGLARVREIADHHPEAPAYHVLSRVDEVRLVIAQEGLEQGFVVIDQLRHLLSVRSHPPLLRMVDALAARWRIEAHDLHRAEELIARLHHGSVRSLLAARLDLAHGRSDDAMRRLQTTDFVTPRDCLSADLLRARAAADVDPTSMHDFVERAARVAAREGFVRTVLEEGLEMVRSVRRVAERFESPDGRRLVLALGAPPHAVRRAQPLVRLSDREQAVLRFLPTRMTNQEIAVECYMSVNTVKTHLKNIYAKLDVSSRSEAVHRARGLALLTS